MRFTGQVADAESLDRDLGELMTHIKERDKAAIRKDLKGIIPCYKPNGTLPKQ